MSPEEAEGEEPGGARRQKVRSRGGGEEPGGEEAEGKEAEGEERRRRGHKKI
jgi:hypothetical protein